MYTRLGLRAACVLGLLIGCSSKRDLGDVPDAGGGNSGTAGTGSGMGGRGGEGGGEAGTGGGAGDGVSGSGGGASGSGGGGASGSGGGGASGSGGGGVSGSGGGGVSGSGGTAGPGRACNPEAAFGTVLPVAGLNSLQDDNGIDFSATGLTVYVSSQRPGGAGGLDILSASRASTADAFGTLSPVPGVNTAGHEYEPRISADGLKLFFTSAPLGNARYDVVVATRSSPLTAFGPAASLLNVSSSANEADCFLTADGKSIYFASDRPGGLGSRDIWVADIGADGSPGTPRLVAELSSTGDDADPVLTPDGLVVYLSSNRGTGNADVYMATRSTVNDGFGTPRVVTELNSASQDFPVSVSADGCTLYLCSEKTAGTDGRTGADVFSATRGQ